MDNFDIATWEAIKNLIYNILGDDFFMDPEYSGMTVVEALNALVGG